MGHFWGGAWQRVANHAVFVGCVWAVLCMGWAYSCYTISVSGMCRHFLRRWYVWSLPTCAGCGVGHRLAVLQWQCIRHVLGCGSDVLPYTRLPCRASWWPLCDGGSATVVHAGFLRSAQQQQHTTLGRGLHNRSTGTELCMDAASQCSRRGLFGGTTIFRSRLFCVKAVL